MKYPPEGKQFQGLRRPIQLSGNVLILLHKCEFSGKICIYVVKAKKSVSQGQFFIIILEAFLAAFRGYLSFLIRIKLK